jgi:predicted outer membrane repeat protein
MPIIGVLWKLDGKGTKTIMKRLLAFIFLGLFCTLFSACTPTPGSPDIYDPGCSSWALIEAVNQANNDPGPAVINLEADCEYPFAIADNTQTINGVAITSALPAITSDISLVGNNAILTTTIGMGLDAPRFGFFLVQPNGSLRMEDLTMRNGWRSLGGAIYINRGSVFVKSILFLYNIAEGQQPDIPGKGGAIYNREGRLTVLHSSRFESNGTMRHNTEGENAAGGGIFSSNGFLLVLNSSFTGNSASQGGAIGLWRSEGAEGLDGVIISGSQFTQNSANKAGAIYAEGEYTPFYISGSNFTENQATELGGAIQIKDSILDLGYSDFSGNEADNCGAVDNSTDSEMIVSGVTFESNTASESGGGLCHEGESLRISNSRFLSNLSGAYGGGIYATRSFSIRNSTFETNQAVEYGGGVYAGDTVAIKGSSFSSNTAYRGGGLYAGWLPGIPDGPNITVGIRQSTFYANKAGSSTGHWDPVGGGIAFAGKNLDIDQSTIWRNQSHMGSGVYASSGRINVVNSSISMNLFGNGAGLYLANGVESSLLNASIVDNQSTSGNATLVVSGPTTIKNTIVISMAGDMPGCQFSGPGPISAVGENMNNDGSCTGFSLITSIHGVNGLADNGGPTLTNKLTTSSPAVDAAADCGGLTVDQRGEPRPYGSLCDLGAYELGANNPNPPPPPLPENPLPVITDTPPAAQGLCEYRAIQNANCREGDDARTALLKVLTKGDVVQLLSLNPELTHGLFEIPDGRSCWVWLPLMEGPPDPRQSCNATIIDPLPYVPEAPVCSADLPKDQCEAAGGTMSGGVTTAPRCVCPTSLKLHPRISPFLSKDPGDPSADPRLLSYSAGARRE